MSGRLIITPYNIELEAGQAVDQPAPLITGFNIAPATQLSLLRQQGKHLTLEPAFWSFTPPWMKQLHEAPYILRSDKLATSPMFKESFEKRRCLLPVTGYYVWRQLPHCKQAFAIRRAHNRPFFLAGLWTRYPVAPDRAYDSFGLISVPADTWLGRLTPRLPLLLEPENLSAWLKPTTPLPQIKSLLKAPQQELEYHPVSDLVNRPENQSAQVAAPIGERHKPF